MHHEDTLKRKLHESAIELDPSGPGIRQLDQAFREVLDLIPSSILLPSSEIVQVQIRAARCVRWLLQYQASLH